MSYSIVVSKRFLKAAKRYNQGGKRRILEIAEEAVSLLSRHDRDSLSSLVANWRDHELKGNKRGIRELHLGFDELLLYGIDHKTRTIELIDIVSHEELNKR